MRLAYFALILIGCSGASFEPAPETPPSTGGKTGVSTLSGAPGILGGQAGAPLAFGGTGGTFEPSGGTGGAVHSSGGQGGAPLPSGGQGGAPEPAGGRSGCLVYYPDADGDGYGIPVPAESCVDLGAGWATNDLDCNDENPNVYPGQEAYFTEPYIKLGMPSFDYNCNGKADTDPMWDGRGKRPDGFCTTYDGVNCTAINGLFEGPDGTLCTGGYQRCSMMGGVCRTEITPVACK